MNIIVKRTILYYCEKYPTARLSLLTWFHEFSKQTFKHFNELKTTYGNSSLIAQNRVIFNIKGNEFRLIVSVNFRQQAAYIIWFGTHSEYNRINAATVEINSQILKFKPR